MDVATRRMLIAEQISRIGEVDFASLSSRFDVSEMTIRRDIEVLEESGLVRRVVGGAISVRGTSTEPPFESRASRAAQEKEHIALAVVNLLEPAETVFLDSGSTVLSVARAIRGRNLGLTVVTPSILAGIELADEPNTTVFLTGGKVRSGELSLIGQDAIEAFSRFNGNTFVMGVAGVDAIAGVSDYSYEETHVKKAAAKAAKRVILAVDHTKFGQISLVNISSLAEVSIIVTDATGDDPTLKAASDAGVRVITTARETELAL